MVNDVELFKNIYFDRALHAEGAPAVQLDCLHLLVIDGIILIGSMGEH